MMGQGGVGSRSLSSHKVGVHIELSYFRPYLVRGLEVEDDVKEVMARMNR